MYCSASFRITGIIFIFNDVISAAELIQSVEASLRHDVDETSVGYRRLLAAQNNHGMYGCMQLQLTVEHQSSNIRRGFSTVGIIACYRVLRVSPQMYMSSTERIIITGFRMMTSQRRSRLQQFRHCFSSLQLSLCCYVVFKSARKRR